MAVTHAVLAVRSVFPIPIPVAVSVPVAVSITLRLRSLLSAMPAPVVTSRGLTAPRGGATATAGVSAAAAAVAASGAARTAGTTTSTSASTAPTVTAAVTAASAVTFGVRDTAVVGSERYVHISEERNNRKRQEHHDQYSQSKFHGTLLWRNFVWLSLGRTLVDSRSPMVIRLAAQWRVRTELWIKQGGCQPNE
jgi:hypothetical protein